MSVDERLAQFLKDARDWEKKVTSIPRLFILKLPSLRGNPSSIAVEINPVDALGSPTKKRGVVIRSAELQWIKEILSNPKVVELAENIYKVNPREKVATPYKTSTNIFEV